MNKIRNVAVNGIFVTVMFIAIFLIVMMVDAMILSTTVLTLELTCNDKQIVIEGSPFELHQSIRLECGDQIQNIQCDGKEILFDPQQTERYNRELLSACKIE